MLAVMFGLFMGITANRNSALGVVLLLVLTGFMGLMLGPILQVALHLKNGAQLVGLAAGGTGIIFMSLASVATVTKKDFSFIGNFLFIGLVLLVVASFANLFFQIPALALALSGVSVLIFSGYILYDVSRIVQGGETNYVMATLALYLDIYNLFVNLLQLLMALMGERD
jgi:FtsH-binding integral membrane protein